MPLTGKPNLTVTFVDASTPSDEITYWSWDFGDGSADYVGQTPPAHAYNSLGAYAVTLHVASEKGSDTFTDTVTVALEAFTIQAGLAVSQPIVVVGTDFISDPGDYTLFRLSRTPGGPYTQNISIVAGDLGVLTLYVLGLCGAFTLELPVAVTVI